MPRRATARNPLVTRRIGILPAIGDLLAIRKALGFAGVGSKAHFCSFCKLHKNDIEELDSSKFIPRIGTDVRAAAEQWRTATTKKARAEIFKIHGVRTSSLNVLSYRDPVKHTILGLMHNWIEGVLQHHVRHRWGVGSNEARKTWAGELEPKLAVDCASTSATIDLDADVVMGSPSLSAFPSDNDTDFMDIDNELLDLFEESKIARKGEVESVNTGSAPGPNPSTLATGWLFDICVTDDSDNDEEYHPEEDADYPDSDGDLGLEDSVSPIATSIFSTSQLSVIRLCLTDATVPSWVERPPSNLGEKTHGKLKADQWLKLFIVFLPMVLPEIWDDKSTQPLLDNFYSLVTCTNIVCTYTVSDGQPDLYLHHYVRYRTTSAKLFAHAPSRPNHHFAMHNAELMRFWGPLIQLSEFPYEQHNGTLQKIKTNGHLYLQAQSDNSAVEAAPMAG
ncbi:hypothetical protein BKA70DRAFT_1441915 [Coprinopsis sp. MPI-PUGE-AT-0042]|nr:hypothetical protein BKA70DRAFT_1441915 [Coprinopsis sp. MPI-PUGE-AT-0042]